MTQVAVFIDWQNTYKSAREAFGWVDYPNEYGNYSPYQLARLLATENGRGDAGVLERVNIHRGLPSQKHDREGYAANRKQSAAWMKEAPEVVVPKLRPLRYGREIWERPREKGVDVALALEAAERLLVGKCEVAIVFSHDTDLVPLIEMMCRLSGSACIETASWAAEGFHQRMRTNLGVYHHFVPRETFDQVERRINYAHH